MSEIEAIKLTEYAHGAGCGCKIAPKVLEEILSKSGANSTAFDKLLVGNSTNDDAAAYDLGDGRTLIATTDFFMPIVDDAFDFGRVAAANAISDVYAMGGKPLLALAILGWPVDKLPAALAAKVIEGAKSICAEAGIPLAGGHSIDTTEPVFGLSVNGLVETNRLKRNVGARPGDAIYLTKAIGTGLLSTAFKRKVLDENFKPNFINHLVKLNSFGAHLSNIEQVNALTDVTGFGLLGHLSEICKGSDVSAVINYNNIKLLPGTQECIAKAVMPDATFRNWNAYSGDLKIEATVNSAEAFMVLADPQTNGGLLFTVGTEATEALESAMKSAGLADFAHPIGKIVTKDDKLIHLHP